MPQAFGFLEALIEGSGVSSLIEVVLPPFIANDMPYSSSLMNATPTIPQENKTT